MATSSKKYWGEIDSEDSIPSEDISYASEVSADIERSMNKFCLVEFDADYDDNGYQSENLTLESMDPLMLYAISLHKYINDLNDMIRVAELAVESDLIPPPDVVPPMPKMPEIPIQHAQNCLNFIPKEYTSFSTGQGKFVPELSSSVVRTILFKSIATMCAHIGYETTHQSVLSVLVDILIEFFKKICNHVKVAAEDEENGQLCGFPNIAERVLVELGFDGVKGLYDYYQTRNIKYIKVLQKRCQHLSKYYEMLISKPASPHTEENKIIRVKVEEDDDVMEVDNTQVHLAIDGEVGFSSLDAGYQLLSSLEAGATSQSLGESEEDTSITISPGVVSIPETDLPSTLSPFTKKKRNK